jgi:hypothetical protein
VENTPPDGNSRAVPPHPQPLLEHLSRRADGQTDEIFLTESRGALPLFPKNNSAVALACSATFSRDDILLCSACRRRQNLAPRKGANYV